jgi:hypothetical protein
MSVSASGQRGGDMMGRALRTYLGGVSATAALFAGIGGAATSALAKPYEQIRFGEQNSEVIDGYCGDLQVGTDFHDSGVVVGRVTGPDGTLRYTQSHHGGGTITNLATGKAFTITWNYTNQDVRVTDNGDGTIRILSQIPGPEKTYGPDGRLLFTNGGTFRLLTILDYGGTLTNPSDDTFVSETVMSSNGGKPQPDFDFCDQFHTLTA